MLVPQKIDDVVYPAAGEVDSLGALDDWIALVDDALTEARNGVNAITWPLTVASLVGILALAADVFEGASDFLAAVNAHPGKCVVGVFLAAVAVAAFCLSNEVTEKRRKLSAIRRAFIRRRRVNCSNGPAAPDDALAEQAHWVVQFARSSSVIARRSASWLRRRRPRGVASRSAGMITTS